MSGSNVISLDEARARRLPAPLTEIEAYWQALRAGRTLPARADVDPRGIAGALAHAFILERVGEGYARVRVSGRALSDLAGLELQGLPLSTLLAPEARPALAEVIEEVCATPAMARLSLTSPAGYGRETLTAHLLLLPLRSDLGDVSRLLGGLVAAGPVGRPPRRFSVAARTLDPVTARHLGGAPSPFPR